MGNHATTHRPLGSVVCSKIYFIFCVQQGSVMFIRVAMRSVIIVGRKHYVVHILQINCAINCANKLNYSLYTRMYWELSWYCDAYHQPYINNLNQWWHNSSRCVGYILGGRCTNSVTLGQLINGSPF